MRKLEKFIIWPLYFDINKGRNEGRRVTKNMAVIQPKVVELQEAAQRLGLQNEVNLETHHPHFNWSKTGSILVEKKDSKEKTIQKLAKELLKIRAAAQQEAK
jgi:signal recognition particle subunit SRP19